LLLLEFGEYFLEDFSAYHFPLPTNDITQSFEIQDSSKIQGRIKLCSRSIIFEPTDVRYPVLRFPYKYVVTEFQKFNLKPHEASQLSIQVTGCFTFVCTQYHEMKAHNKIGPYKTIEYNKSMDTSAIQGYRLLFALVHSDIELFFVKMEQFHHIYKLSEQRGNSNMANTLLQPFIDNALVLSFDTTNLVNFHETLLLIMPLFVRRIRPLISTPGSFMITEQRIYFQPAQLNNIDEQLLSFEIHKIVRLYKKRFMLKNIGIECLLPEGVSYLFIFGNSMERDQMYDLIMSQAMQTIHTNTTTNNLPTNHTMYHTASYHHNAMYPYLSTPSIPSTPSSPTPKLTLSILEVMQKWQKHEISNFEYLMHLNYEADRTFNDLTQYPVFPHILADYKSRKLNFSNPSTYRDLSKPIGALNNERLKYFQDRFVSMPPEDKENAIPPPFLYGTHYSTPGYVLYYLVRVAPEYMLCLQNGRFDVPDRMFHSLPDTWDSCLSNPTDLKELIPEFFMGSGEFLLNSDDLDLGRRHSGERLQDVILPPWAENAKDFIRKNMKALESDYVSQHIHEWIDLIFGYKQQGVQAIAADNVFYYLTYEGSVDIDSITDVRERAAIESQIQEFGQTPKQLFLSPHPSRMDSNNGNGIGIGSVQLSASLLSNSSSNTAASTANANANSNRGRTSSNDNNNNNNGNGVIVDDHHYNSVRTTSPSLTPTAANAASMSMKSSSRHNSMTSPSSHYHATTTTTTGSSSFHNNNNSNSSKSHSSMVDLLSAKDRQLLNMSAVATAAGTKGTAGTGTTGDDLSEQIDVIHLGDDFRQAVESAASSSIDSSLPYSSDGVQLDDTNNNNSSSNKGSIRNSLTMSGFGLGSRALNLLGLGNNTAAVASQKGSALGYNNAAMMSMPVSVDITTLRMFPSEPYYWHSKAIASLSMKITAIEGGTSTLNQQQQHGAESDYILPLSGRKKFIAVISAVAKHSMLKVSCLFIVFISTELTD